MFVGAFQKAIANILVAFLQDANVQRLLQSFGLVEDSALESLAQGVRLSQPLRSDPSALPYLAGDRGITLYSTEPEASQRERLAQWWQLHRQRGTHQGEMRHLHPWFLSEPALPMMRIVHQAGDGSSATWHTLDGAGAYTVHKQTPSNWDWDGVPSAWSRFWLIIYTDQQGFPAQENWDGGADWDEVGKIWDSLYSSAQIADFLAAIREWQSAHSVLWGVILATDPLSFDPTAAPVTDPAGWTTLPAGNWYWTIDPVTGDPTRLPTCSVVYNRGKA